MLLILGEKLDPLVVELLRQAPKSASECYQLSECELLEIPFAYECGATLAGLIRLPSGDVDFRELSGVVTRLSRSWRPSVEFDLRDQFFVFHETVAAWYHLLSDLPCPVTNRYNLRWWAGDSTYPEELANELAMELDLPAPAQRGFPLEHFVHASVYAIPGAAIARDVGAKTASLFLQRNATRLNDWLNRNGLGLCRLDFGERLDLLRVELLPTMEGDEPGVVSEVASLTLRAML